MFNFSKVHLRSLPFAEFALYPLAMINHSHMSPMTHVHLSPGSPPSKSPNLRVMLGTLDTVAEFSPMKRE